jgi:4-aminobutyrate aminotransferase/(S)-3-amino-2-methylpropionate transaminase
MQTISLKALIPGPASQALLARRQAAVWQGPCNIAPIFVERAEGATVIDMDGNVLLDFTGGLGSLNAGRANPKVAEAVVAQARKYLHTGFRIAQYEPYVALAEKLNAITPCKFADKALLVNSGTEAVEILIYAGTHSNVLRFLVPLVITDEQLDEGLDVIERQLAA